MKDFSYHDVEAATHSFSLDQLIGKGSHGSVYKGVLKGGQLVAVKKASEGLQSLHNHAKLRNEIDILASMRNPCVVNLVGVCHGPSAAKLLIMEFMCHGSLHDLLHASSNPPSWPQRATWALQIARAVLSLHEATPAIIHRDIKSANILFDSKWNARLADFSLAVRDSDQSDNHEKVPAAGTIGYLDPCYADSGELGPKNDVFSFGVVLLELISSRKAMDMDREPSSIVPWAMAMIRAGQLSGVCDDRVELRDSVQVPIIRMLQVAARCVSEGVKGRPSMAEVVGELQEVVASMSWGGSIRNKVTERVLHRCVRAWKRCAKKRVTTTRITCRDHLVGGGSDDCGNHECSELASDVGLRHDM